MQFDHKCDIHTTCTLILYLPGGNFLWVKLTTFIFQPIRNLYQQCLSQNIVRKEIHRGLRKFLEIGRIASFSFKIKFFVAAVGTEISLFYHLHRKSKLNFS